jgi:hypothetical protein
MTQSETADSLYALYENCDPALLKRTREAVGMDEGVLARLACLSTAQVRQLEAGGGGLFYSITIKRQAYKRVMMVLGADPPTHAPVSGGEASTESAAATQASSHTTIENIVALSSKSDYLERKPIQDFFLDMRYRLLAHKQFLSALVFLLLALALLVFNARLTSSFPDAPATAEVTPAKQSETSPPIKSAAPPASTAAVSASVAPTVASPAPAAAGSAATVASPAPAVPASAALASKGVATHSGACAFEAGPLAEVVSTSTSKPPNYVYVVSPVATQVCVVDGSKKATLLDLRANEGRSVYGNPPWQLSGNALKDAQIFFQGFRIKVPEGHEKHFKLLENASAQ